MGLLRRQVAQRADPTPKAPPAPAPPPMIEEKCWFCRGEILLDPELPTGDLVALLLDSPGECSYALAHRACAERARGRRVV